MSMRHVNLEIHGVVYADARAAEVALGVCAMTIRHHATKGTLHRVGLGLSGPEPCPVRVRGEDFESPAAAAKHFGVGINVVYRRLAAGRPDDIGLPNLRGLHEAKPVTIGPLSFPSMARASVELGFHREFVRRTLKNGTAAAREKLMAAAIREAGRRAGHVWVDGSEALV